ncbi:methyltransferase domain-containing protein [Shewanella maritima]|uniref:Ribosomal RNA small subunit methyltransferase C n=1 Tax=Shewanella maritima TaxID=2520507 RepID=A0A411PGS9_9GAMM|nr:methyltransferase [Shewanella maritima]QBF82590.1 methyltransferase domain-containing protein [Shewanella maritima]
MLSNPSQVLIRNLDYVENDNVLVLNHEADDLAKQLLESAASVASLALDFNHYLKLNATKADKLECHFGHQLPQELSDKQFDTVIVYFPKAKALSGYLLQLAAQHLKAQGQLLVVGENKGGIKSLPKLAPDYFSKPIKRDNARHCLLFSSILTAPATKLNIADWTSQYQLATPQGELTICNTVGTFSDKKLDAGTELLLAHLPKLHGKVLDFGCGAGVISAALLKSQPELQIDCIDINAMALLSCKLTLEANGMSANVYPSDGFTHIKAKFDGIISNPPFHDGLNATTDIAKDFVKRSALQLNTGGYWQIVANRHLPYADTIAHYFGQFDVPAENNKYKLYTCHK